MSEDNSLQVLCRNYLKRLLRNAEKVGLHDDVQRLIGENEKGDCFSTKEQVDMLSRMVEDSNIRLDEIPKMLNVSYRYMDEHGYFKTMIRKFKNKGNFSKVDTLLLKDKLKKK